MPTPNEAALELPKHLLVMVLYLQEGVVDNHLVLGHSWVLVLVMGHSLVLGRSLVLGHSLVLGQERLGMVMGLQL